MQEEWKQIKGYEGLYEVSNLGRIRNAAGHIMKPQDETGGYFAIGLTKNKKFSRHRIHRLVAEAFVPNPDSLPIVNHKDEDRKNNRADNLEWCTSQYNNSYGHARERWHDTVYRKNATIYHAKEYTLDGVLLTVTTIYTGEKTVLDLRKLTDEMMQNLAFCEK